VLRPYTPTSLTETGEDTPKTTVIPGRTGS
jgi:hypothetical protein